MDIYINKDGQQWGPYSKEDLATYLAQGNFASSDLAWSDGMSEWAPLNSFFSAPAPRSAPPPAPSQSLAMPVSPSYPQSGVNQQLYYESRKKSAGLACLLNFIIPGVGYMYAGMWVMGLVVLMFWAAMFLLGFLTFGLTWIVCGLVWLIGLIDGFLAVGRANRKLAEKAMSGSPL